MSLLKMALPDVSKIDEAHCDLKEVKELLAGIDDKLEKLLEVLASRV